jgi:hypothetical protein
MNYHIYVVEFWEWGKPRCGSENGDRGVLRSHHPQTDS